MKKSQHKSSQNLLWLNRWHPIVMLPQDLNAFDPPSPTCPAGEPLEVTGRPGAGQLSSEEQRLCSAHHVTPKQYLNAKQEVLQKAQSSFITVYDVRTLSSLGVCSVPDAFNSSLR